MKARGPLFTHSDGDVWHHPNHDATRHRCGDDLCERLLYTFREVARQTQEPYAKQAVRELVAAMQEAAEFHQSTDQQAA